MSKPDYRSADAEVYRHLYKTSAWRKGRLIFLAQHPLCKRCLDAKRMSRATVVHHTVPHKGDPAIFFNQSLWEPICKPCHDRDAQAEERRGYSKAIDASGWPTDPRHVANRAR
jgi:5-methylcytosine-specific restriction endonuclease McrA